MGIVTLNDIKITTLKRIPASGGDVLHAMKFMDSGYKNFGEAYFSKVEESAVKAWKMHLRMTLNLVVPIGMVRFVFYSSQRPNEFRVEEIGDERYIRLTVPPGIWFGFKGLYKPSSLVFNFADIPHDPEEVQRLSINEIKYNWQ